MISLQQLTTISAYMIAHAVPSFSEIAFRQEAVIPRLPESLERKYQESLIACLADDDGSSRLVERINSGEQALWGMLSLGARFSCGSSGKISHVFYPDNLFEIINGQYRLIDRWISEGLIDERDVLRIGILYETEEDGIQVFQPGDTLPETARLVDEFVDQRVWETYLKKGFLPVTTAAFDHDVFGHVLDLLSPERMRLASRGLKRFADLGIYERGSMYTDGPGNTFDKAKRRLFQLAEFCSCPDITREEEIQALAPEVFRHGPKKHFKFIRSLDGQDLKLRVDNLVQKLPHLTIRFGGGMLDSYNHEVFESIDRCFYECCKDTPHIELSVGSSLVSAQDLSITQVVMGRVLGMLSEYLFDREHFRDTESQNFKRLVDSLATTHAHNSEEIMLHMMQELTARIELSLYAALKYEMTPEKMLDEGLRLRFIKFSDTAKYFRYFLKPFTLRGLKNENRRALSMLGYT